VDRGSTFSRIRGVLYTRVHYLSPIEEIDRRRCRAFQSPRYIKQTARTSFAYIILTAKKIKGLILSKP